MLDHRDTKRNIQLPIIIIGPICSGKTTISRILAKKLSLYRFPLDAIRWYYYAKSGLDFSKDDDFQKKTFEQLLKFRRPYDIYAVRKSIKEFHNGIIDFGASHSYWEEKSDLLKVGKYLSKVKNVILLLPTNNNDKNVEILTKRLYKRSNETGIDDVVTINRKMIQCKSNYKLAKITAYTEGKSPEQVANWIISKLVMV